MRGERAGRRDIVAKAGRAGTPDAGEGPPAWKALADLIGLVRRSGAPQLGLRLIAAVAMISTFGALRWASRLCRAIAPPIARVKER